jgi:hypothetical protein
VEQRHLLRTDTCATNALLSGVQRTLTKIIGAARRETNISEDVFEFYP